MIVKTETGSTYDVEEDYLVRVEVGSDSVTLRQDGEKLRIIEWVQKPEVGRRMIMMLAPLEPREFVNSVATMRSTSPVVSIEERLANLPAAVQKLADV